MSMTKPQIKPKQPKLPSASPAGKVAKHVAKGAEIPSKSSILKLGEVAKSKRPRRKVKNSLSRSALREHISYVRPPLTDEQLGPIPGLPTEAEIEIYVGNLSSADKAAFTRIRRLLAESLGSHAAARAWLVTQGDGFVGTPLDAIRDGSADRVLKILNAQSSRNPPYA